MFKLRKRFRCFVKRNYEVITVALMAATLLVTIATVIIGLC